jgi:glycosyltransferase involved in cell wall biosynthesis
MNHKIKILIISQPALAGVKRHVVDLLLSINTEEFEVSYIFSRLNEEKKYPDDIQQIRDRGIACYEVPMYRSISPLRDLISFLKIFQLIRKIRPDIVHVHSSKAGVLGRFAAKTAKRSIKIIYTPHAMSLYFSRVYYPIEKFFGFFSDSIIAVSDTEREDIIRWNVVPERMIVKIPLSVPDAYPTVVDASKRKFRVAACGEIRDQKNPRLFFDVGAHVLQHADDVEFIWIGDFGSAPMLELKEYIRNDPFAAKVQITGWLEYPNTVLATCDLFCMFSNYESFGYVTADAMMMRVPVLGISSGAKTLVRHLETGYVVDKNCDDLARAVLTLKNDPALRDSLAEKAHAYVSKNYSGKAMIEKTEALYKSLVS